MNTISRRKFLQAAGFTAIGASLAACVAPQAPTAQEGGADAMVETFELSVSTPTHNDEYKSLLDQTILPAFVEQHPGATVAINYSDWNRYNEELTTAFAGGVTPDVFLGGAVYAPQMVKRNWVMELDDYVANASDEWNWEDFFAATIDDVTINGKIVGIPSYFDVRPFWYRSDHLEEAGIANPPTNWEELRETAIALTQREGDQIVREGFHYSGPGAWQNDLLPFMPFLRAAGGDVLNEDMTQCVLDSDPAIEALEFIHQLIVVDKVQPYPGFDREGDVKPFVSGKASMSQETPQQYHNTEQYAPGQEQYLKSTLPLTHNVQATQVWPNKLFVSQMTKQPDAAWALAAHLSSPENLALFCKSLTLIPSRRSLGNEEFMTEPMKVGSAAAEFGVPYPKYDRLLELYRPFATNLELCLRGELSPVDTMKATVEAANAILAEG